MLKRSTITRRRCAPFPTAVKSMRIESSMTAPSFTHTPRPRMEFRMVARLIREPAPISAFSKSPATMRAGGPWDGPRGGGQGRVVGAGGAPPPPPPRGAPPVRLQRSHVPPVGGLLVGLQPGHLVLVEVVGEHAGPRNKVGDDALAEVVVGVALRVGEHGFHQGRPPGGGGS